VLLKTPMRSLRGEGFSLTPGRQWQIALCCRVCIRMRSHLTSGVHVQAAFHAISTGQDMSSYSRASPRHAQHARARPEEAPIEHVYGIQGACVAIGTVLFGVVVWWWSSGVSDGTKHYDMTRMAREERCVSGICCCLLTSCPV
jgi:hypothetical protein